MLTCKSRFYLYASTLVGVTDALYDTLITYGHLLCPLSLAHTLKPRMIVFKLLASVGTASKATKHVVASYPGGGWSVEYSSTFLSASKMALIPRTHSNCSQ